MPDDDDLFLGAGQGERSQDNIELCRLGTGWVLLFIPSYSVMGKEFSRVPEQYKVPDFDPQGTGPRYKS